jgi:hypothetical protein
MPSPLRSSPTAQAPNLPHNRKLATLRISRAAGVVAPGFSPAHSIWRGCCSALGTARWFLQGISLRLIRQDPSSLPHQTPHHRSAKCPAPNSPVIPSGETRRTCISCAKRMSRRAVEESLFDPASPTDRHSDRKLATPLPFTRRACCSAGL